jgi:hypothetical protein
MRGHVAHDPIGSRQHVLDNCSQCQVAGDFARGVASHAVGHDQAI